MDKWRLILVGIFAGLSSLGGASIEPKQLEGMQVIVGIGTFPVHMNYPLFFDKQNI